MNKVPYIYLDENIIQYAYENIIKIDNVNNVEWIFSDEHFNEIERSKSLKYLDVLKKLKARRIQIKLNDKYQILNEAYIHEYKDPEEVYNEYKNNIALTNENNIDFASLQVFMFGNKEIIDIDQYVNDYILSIENMMKPIFEYIKNTELKISYKAKLDKLKEDLTNTLKIASTKIKPIEEIRKKIVGQHLSTLNIDSGLIIDQIWSKIQEKNDKLPITKDQFFGKERMPFLSDYDNWPLFLGISQCHSVLNYLGYWPDEGLKKISKIYGINSDSSHIGHAAFCTGIISADDRLCKKAKAIYDYFKLPVEVIKMYLISKN